MSSKPIESFLTIEGRVKRGWSIAVRLVLFFTVAAAVLLLGMMAAAYWVVVRRVDHDNDRYLQDKLAAIQADMAVDAGPESLNRELRIVKASDKAYAVRVLDNSGKIVAESPRMNKIVPIEVFPKTIWPLGQRPTTLLYHGHRNRVFALVTATARIRNQNLVIQLAQDRTHDETFARHFAGLLAAMACCAIATCAGIAVLVIRRSLRPLKDLADSIERTGASHLRERVPVGNWPEELQPLAVGFNKMLGRLDDSFTRLSQFSADLAHELRTPIAILRGEAEGILTRPRTSDQYREVIESSLEELQRLSGMIDNLLFLARAETTGSFKLSHFDGRQALENIREFYEAVAQDKGVEIECHGEGEIYAEPTLFRRALINLLTNALRFTPAGGNINVLLNRQNGGSEVTVTDTGCGIASQHVPNVFNRFFRGDATRSAEGTGLGLSIVKSIMQIHNGSVTVDSEIDRGTVITLTFPDANGSKPHPERNALRAPETV
jgi:two-component system heavy metal sensor histidine kinase CusS